MGVHGIFPPGSPMQDIIDFIHRSAGSRTAVPRP
jgi:hypothetical protein